ncbi:hypothetical protein [Lewinella sp. W8]|uniref:hypothetical protein n=1 Tax=Lewinella sp. W8 TaxID=2528208 RepID=UPI0010672A00|nr:hypothetical protein [Lewinella sp. W8]MTB53533.1 hypothetical protein [Lewinella sp. W8]
MLWYDDHNNVLFDVETYSINDPARIDTNRWEYQYRGDRIRFQYRKLSDHDSTVIKLVKNQGDTLLQYREEAHYYRLSTGVTDVFETVYTLAYSEGRLIKKEEFDVNQNARKITQYSYYDHGRIKRKQIDRIPESADEPVYVGGPGSDDESYEYKLDDAGRVTKFYKIIGGRKFLIATYRYRKNDSRRN